MREHPDITVICKRPRMYFGDSSYTSVELAAFVNGYMSHRGGMMCGGFSMMCQADPRKTPEENGAHFLTQVAEWEKDKQDYNCCIDSARVCSLIKPS